MFDQGLLGYYVEGFVDRGSFFVFFEWVLILVRAWGLLVVVVVLMLLLENMRPVVVEVLAFFQIQ